MTATTQDLKTNLEPLIAAALAGEEVILTQNGKNLVRLVAFEPPASNLSTPSSLRPIGIYKGQRNIDPDFERRSMEPLSEEELRDWGL
jgi:prevent-host-death family protein